MNLTFISDTHNKHQKIICDTGDILFHCGDFTGRGEIEHVTSFAKYMESQDFRYKVVIAGNHDFCLENELQQEAEQILLRHRIIYLNDSGVELLGLKIWGSPVQPWFHDWAFNRSRGEDIKKHWDLIPNGTDILLTHGPAYGILDETSAGENVGCEELLSRLEEIRPRVHAFGHIHEAYGIKRTPQTTFINVSMVDVRNRPKNHPIKIKL